jgi:methyltransferase (TIGR00027 family)
MKPGQRSRTADAAAALRASHALYARPAVFSDPYALELTSPGWRRVVGNRLLHHLVLRRLFKRLAPVTAQIVGRSRYAEDCLADALQRGVKQYVIVGAGLDSFALRRRDLEQSLRVYEVDHPDTQRAKREQLAARGISLPSNLEFAAVNFETEDIAAGLRRSSYRAPQPAFYSWLGTTHYLRNEATLATLAAIAGFAAAGSEIVFDYSLPSEMMPPEVSRSAERLRRSTARQGEPMIGGIDPQRLHRELPPMGYTIVEDLDGREQEQRYFAGRSDGLRPSGASRFMHLRLR